MEVSALPCPVCGGLNEASGGRKASAFVSVAGGREFYHPAYGVCRCSACAVHFKTAHLSDEDLADYYAHLEYESFESEALLPPDRLIVRVAQALPAGSRILDYGCGVARSLAHSVSRHDCYGVEPNARAGRVASERGVKVVADSALDTEYVAFFDLIVLSDVYEHLSRPLGVMQRLVACLRPGGKLVMVTGLADGVQPPELSAECWYFRVAGHLHMVSVRHLEWLARRTGLTLESHVALCHYEPDMRGDAIQRIKLWAYITTHVTPSSVMAKVVRALPLLKRAALWNNAPMLSCGKDHVFATFRKQEDTRK